MPTTVPSAVSSCSVAGAGCCARSMTRRTWLELGAAVAALALLTFWWPDHESLGVDAHALRWVIDHVPRGRVIDGPFLFFTYTADPLPAILITGFAAWALWRQAGPRAAMAVILAALVVVPAEILQKTAPQQPLATLVNRSDNFPSVHTAFAAATYGMLFLIARERRWIELQVGA